MHSRCGQVEFAPCQSNVDFNNFIILSACNFVCLPLTLDLINTGPIHILQSVVALKGGDVGHLPPNILSAP